MTTSTLSHLLPMLLLPILFHGIYSSLYIELGSHTNCRIKPAAHAPLSLSPKKGPCSNSASHAPCWWAYSRYATPHTSEIIVVLRLHDLTLTSLIHDRINRQTSLPAPSTCHSRAGKIKTPLSSPIQLLIPLDGFAHVIIPFIGWLAWKK